MNESGCDLFWVHCFALLLFKLPLRCDDDDDDNDNDYDDGVYDEKYYKIAPPMEAPGIDDGHFKK